MEKFFWAFVVGGGICVIGQLMLDVRTAPVSCYYYISSSRGCFGWVRVIEPLTKFPGAGATVPISSFGPV